MGKTYKPTRLWLLLLLCCIATASKASGIAISGYTPSDEYDGAPLFKLNETLIEVRLTEHSLFNHISVDDKAVMEDEFHWSYTLDMSAYNDNSIHKLVLSFNEDNKVCYFKFGSVVYTPGKYDIGNIYYEVTNNEAEVVGAAQDIKVAVINSEYWTAYENKPYPVTSIRKGAFNNCSDLVSVRIPESITSISVDAFEECNNLKSVYFNATNCSVCGFEDDICWSEVFPPSIERVIIGNNVKTIPNNAFFGCSALTTLDIPESVTAIGNRSFLGCSGLTSITIPNSVTSIGDHSFSSCSGLTSITIPESVSAIGWDAFGYCSGLTSVYIPQYVAQFGSCPFYGCHNLKEINVDNNNEYYSSTDGILLNKDETELIQWPGGKEPCYIPSSVTKIAWAAFGGNSRLKNIVIPNSVVEIGTGAFGWSGLTSITIPNSVTTIGEMAFQRCHLTSVYIPSSVTTIKTRAFEQAFDMSPATVEFESIESLANILFEDKYANPLLYAEVLYINGEKIKDLIIPETVTAIGAYSFYYKELTSITIPATVTAIGCNAFGNCYNCSSVTCLSTIPPVLDSEVFRVKETATLYVPHGSISLYQNSDWAQYFANIIELTPETEATLTLKGADNHSFTLVYREGTKAIVRFQHESGWDIHSVTYNGEDVTNSIANDTFVTEPLHGDNNLNMVLVSNDPAEIKRVKPESNHVTISVSNNAVTINGLDPGDTINIYDLKGRIVYSGFDRCVKLKTGNSYILATPSKTFKISI